MESCNLQLVYVGFNSVPNLIVIMFNLLYPVFMWDFIVRIVYERECENLRQLKTKEVFAGISQEGLALETLSKTNCHHPVMTLRILVMCWAHASLRKKASRELPVKTSLVFNCLKSSHTLSHITLTIKSHIKYRVQNIENNYNQIWHGIKANIK